MKKFMKSADLRKGIKAAGVLANCAKSFVTREGVGRVAKVFVAPEVGLPWAEWIKT
jgi:hypothetical protein